MPILATLDTAPPVLPETQWVGLDVSWTDGRGTVWDLNSDSRGVVLSQGGVRGLGMPRFDRYTQESPALAGSRWRGFRTLERDAFWPIFIWSDTGSQQWIERERAFWAGLRPDTVGRWRIGTPDGASRSLPLRFVDDGDPSFDADPVQRGWYVYGITLVAEQPYWEGPPITRSWRVTTNADWLSPPSGVFRISAGASIETATATNPGDVDSWPLWQVTGPVNGASLGVGGGVVDYLDPIAGGVTVTIDTRPDRMTAITSTGQDVSGSVLWSPLPVPPGETVATNLALTAAGEGAQATLVLTPLYHRAY